MQQLHIGRPLVKKDRTLAVFISSHPLGSGAEPGHGRRAAEEVTTRSSNEPPVRNTGAVTAGKGGELHKVRHSTVRREARELGASVLLTHASRLPRNMVQSIVEHLAPRSCAACGTRDRDPNERLLESARPSTSMLDGVQDRGTTSSARGRRGSLDLITTPGLINLDFADVRTPHDDAARPAWGIWPTRRGGEDRAKQARSRRPLAVIHTDIAGARGILPSIVRRGLDAVEAK